MPCVGQLAVLTERDEVIYPPGLMVEPDQEEPALEEDQGVEHVQRWRQVRLVVPAAAIVALHRAPDGERDAGHGPAVHVEEGGDVAHDQERQHRQSNESNGGNSCSCGHGIFVSERFGHMPHSMTQNITVVADNVHH